jgi:hypothetical protein
MGSLAALISAYQDADAPDAGLRATLPLAGRTLVERQARLAASAGAAPIIILVERMPPELVQALQRLRSEGVAVAVARTAAEAAEAVHPDDRLLLVADGLVADETHIARLLAAGSNALLTVPDHGAGDGFERIDAHSRWGGLALLTGNVLKQTVTMLRDWDLQSTLLRRAVQGGARQFSVRGEANEAKLIIAASREDLASAERQIIEGAVSRRDGWVSRYLLAPAEQAATRLLMPTRIMPEWLRLLAVAMTGVGAYAFARDLLWTGSALMLLATPLDDIADRLATLRMQIQVEESWWSHLLPTFAAAALLALAFSLSRSSGWGCLALAVATLAFMGALRLEIGERDVDGKIFLADRKGMVWVMLPFAVTASWLSGLIALAAYAAGSFFWAQRQVHRPISAAGED